MEATVISSSCNSQLEIGKKLPAPETGHVEGSYADLLILSALKGGKTKRHVITRAINQYCAENPEHGTEMTLRNAASRILNVAARHNGSRFTERFCIVEKTAEKG